MQIIIDTPAFSLHFIKLFPQYCYQGSALPTELQQRINVIIIIEISINVNSRLLSFLKIALLHFLLLVVIGSAVQACSKCTSNLFT